MFLNFDISASSGETKNITLDGLTITGGRTPENVSEANHGGGIYFNGGEGSSGEISFTIRDSTIEGNTASGEGGGVYVLVPGKSSGQLENNFLLENSRIFGNSAVSQFHTGAGGGLALYLSSYASASIDRSVIEQNNSEKGGGLFVEVNQADFVQLAVLDSTIRENTVGTAPSLSNDGGGIYLEEIPLPGAIDPSTNEYVISGSTISGNTAYSNGGGIFAYHVGELHIINSTISGNQAVAQGGGMRVFEASGITRISHSTIVENQVGFDTSNSSQGPILGAGAATGGGLVVGGDGITGATLTVLDHSIVTKNLDLWDDLTNPVDRPISDIFIRTSPHTSSGQDVVQQQILASYSIVGKVIGGFTDTAPNNPLGLQDANVLGIGVQRGSALLGPLQDNGGPTETHMPADTSPAIDAGELNFTIANYPVVNGTTLTTDQRGFSRIKDINEVSIAGRGPIDIGAVEVQSFAPIVTEVVISNTLTGKERSYFELVNEFDSAAGDQIRALPFSESNRIEITFSEPVMVMGNELSVRSLGTMAHYAVLDKGWVVGKPNTYAWELNAATFQKEDHVLLKLNDIIYSIANPEKLLDGEWINPTSITPTVNVDMISEFPSGNGTSGGDFHFVFTTYVPGDFNNDNFSSSKFGNPGFEPSALAAGNPPKTLASTSPAASADGSIWNY